jgi:hypothetical protein
LFPAPHRRRPGAFNNHCTPAEHAEIISSTAAVAKKLATVIVDLPPNTPASATAPRPLTIKSP